MLKSLLTAISLAAAVSASAALTVSPSIKRAPAAATRLTAARKAAPVLKVAPEGEWKSLGNGTWHEQLFVGYGFEADLTWSVEIEESVSTPGYYRLIPYGEASALAEELEEVDETYFYVNATDPEKVYVGGDFMPYDGTWIFSHCVAENDWEDEIGEDNEPINYYGTLTEGVISFPVNAFCEYYGGDDENDEGWYYANFEGPVEIELPAKTDESDAIAEISAEKTAVAAVYDLQGRRLAAPVRGINIANGRKFLVK